MNTFDAGKFMDRLAEILKQQEPRRVEIIQALEFCKKGHWDGEAYLRFVDARNANQPGAQWQFKESIVLIDSEEGELILDILTDGRIGGIEFIDRLK